MNFADYLLDTTATTYPAVITEEATYSYDDLRTAVMGATQALLAAGVAPTDRVGLFGSNSFHWIVNYLAAIKSGARVVPFATTLMVEELRAKIEQTQCKVMYVEQRLLRRFKPGVPEDVAVLSDDLLQAAPALAWRAAPQTADDVDAALMFTSGTTAQPRLVRVTHRNLRANTESIIASLGLTSEERIMAVLPFYYCYGASLLHTHLRVGGTLVLNNFAYPEKALDLMQAKQCTGFAGVPFTYQTLLRNSTFPKRPFESLHKVQQAGGKLPTALIEELVKLLPQAQIYIMYGQTEATARLSCLPPQMILKKLGSIGKGLPGTTLRVVNEAGQAVAPGEVGEIIARGDNITAGYLDEPTATAEKFVNGELRTGDLATVDEDGYIYIVDRKSDFIKPYGHRVSSQQIEACLLELPEVVAAAAIGEPDEVSGEAIKVFVILRAQATLAVADMLAHCQQRLARHMHPKTIVVTDKLPMNAQGKIVKADLRKFGSQQIVPV